MTRSPTLTSFTCLTCPKCCWEHTPLKTALVMSQRARLRHQSLSKVSEQQPSFSVFASPSENVPSKHMHGTSITSLSLKRNNFAGDSKQRATYTFSWNLKSYFILINCTKSSKEAYYNQGYNMVFWFRPVSSDRHTELCANATAAPAASPANTGLTTRCAEITFSCCSFHLETFRKQQPTFQSAARPARLWDIVGEVGRGGWLQATALSGRPDCRLSAQDLTATLWSPGGGEDSPWERGGLAREGAGGIKGTSRTSEANQTCGLSSLIPALPSLCLFNQDKLSADADGPKFRQLRALTYPLPQQPPSPAPTHLHGKHCSSGAVWSGLVRQRSACWAA